ncbi:MAG: hypothetical protein LCH36_02305 [Actinobacteria bacterium]|nr:hypothetical protein [Actinomycetota bacterium]
MMIQKILVSFASVAGLVACATAERAAEPTPPTITLEEAREFQNGVLLDLAEYLPDGSVVGGFEAPIPKMHGMTCDWARGSLASPASGVFLPGGYDLKVSSDVDLDKVREEIRLAYVNQGWEALWEEPGEYQDLNLASPDGYEFFLGVRVVDSETSEFVMSSFSPCLKAPEGFTLFDEY